MTLIEIFDRTPVENLITTLAVKPDRVVFVGPESRRARRSLPAYEKILAGRGLHPELTVRGAARNDIESIVETLLRLTSKEDEPCLVDISGGDESTLVAFGIVLGRSGVRGKNVSAFRINVVSRRGVRFRITDGGTVEREVVDYSADGSTYLTVEENIFLHGGTVYDRGIAFRRGDPVEADIEALWELCREDCTGWNARIGKLSAAVSRYSGEVGVTGLFALPEAAFGKKKADVDRSLWEALVARGLVEIDEKRTAVSGGLILFRYPHPIVEECLNKSGSVLEYYTYLTALHVKEDGRYLFDSVETGITMDWDDDASGTRNEIDCMLTSGLVPVFISCKNGDVKTDELYKLDTVADQFGSGYAKKALLSTVWFDEESSAFCGERAAKNLKERADDMEIRTISRVHRMSRAELEEELRKLLR